MFGASSSGQTSKGLAAARAHQHKVSLSERRLALPPSLPPPFPIPTSGLCVLRVCVAWVRRQLFFSFAFSFARP